MIPHYDARQSIPAQVSLRYPEHWTTRAACLDEDPELFFPDSYPGTSDWETPRRVCMRCPVREQCDKEADRQGEKFGMFGGRTPDERLHGTSAAYYRHRRAGEDPCARCKAAQAQRSRELRAARRGA